MSVETWVDKLLKTIFNFFFTFCAAPVMAEISLGYPFGFFWFFFTYSGIQIWICKFQVIVITHDVDLLDALSRGTQIEHYHKVSRDENGESIVTKTAVSSRWWKKNLVKLSWMPLLSAKFWTHEVPIHSVLKWIWIKGSYLSQWLPQGERGPPKKSKSRWIEILHGGSQFT